MLRLQHDRGVPICYNIYIKCIAYGDAFLLAFSPLTTPYNLRPNPYLCLALNILSIAT